MECWPRDEVSAWYANLPWLCGFNYLPRTAINWIELWQAETFDAATIEEELGWAADVGFNTLRTNLHSLVWQADPAGLRARIDRFLGIAARRGITTMLCPFDDCGFAGREPSLGPQGDPLPGVHNSAACASPGRAVVQAGSDRALLRDYVEDLVGHFRDDARIVAWDLYNEPGNDSLITASGGSRVTDSLLPHSMELVESTFAWARSKKPTQPLTVGVWNPLWREANARWIDLSDFVTFHNYLGLEALQAHVESLKRHGRPLVCTEWLARGLGSRVETHLPYFAGERIGCYHWGLVNGRTQTHFPWPGLESLYEGGLWHHDLFHSDGSVYDAREIEIFRRFCAGRE